MITTFSLKCSRFYYDKLIRLTVFAQMRSVQAANRLNQETITIIVIKFSVIIFFLVFKVTGVPITFQTEH